MVFKTRYIILGISKYVKRENETGDCGGWGGVVEWVVESKFETGGYGTC